jgi:phage I-like protein
MNEQGVKLESVLALNYKEGEKVKVCPTGDVIGLDGRGFKIDVNTLLSTLQKNELDIPLDENHSFGEALGWFLLSSFEARNDGLYATLELNEDGKRLIENKKYRYLSPVFVMGDNRNVAGLECVGLVNRPNLLNRALNKIFPKTNKENEMNELELAKQQLTEMNAKKAEIERTLEALRTENAALKTQLDTNAKKFREQKVENAIKAGELTANKRDYALSLENDTQLDAFLALSKTDAELLKAQTPLDKNTKTLSDAQKAVYEQLGIKE